MPHITKTNSKEIYSVCYKTLSLLVPKSQLPVRGRHLVEGYQGTLRQQYTEAPFVKHVKWE